LWLGLPEIELGVSQKSKGFPTSYIGKPLNSICPKGPVIFSKKIKKRISKSKN